METRDPELKKELDATLHARRELGEEYESALVDSFLDKVEQRIDDTVDRRVRRHLAEQQMVAARGSGPARHSPEPGFGERFGFGVVSLLLAVPLSAIGVVNAGLLGLITAWAGIVGVNAVHAAGPSLHRWLRRGGGDRSASERED
ncbi:hypothetical protein [Streptomyces clavuligerus]|uniref:Integral membrane protein n=1 Tax=Streptomyces clavuligerus TaxID=1901 RepID=B5GZQ4_STRCL|nr:hypothetical protein [Streptomyces clavuligerus]ANW19864.1 hypothetical protein BB341_17375 [Streptomyces clavuligerus]AXU14480.1 hypothetical protein D1794_18145 [Streptomyces clavuligerus]EDY51800.1 integral membrane protein [Streptomyces clavuligerus]EFG07271.1 Integral membrane protein [Streptomyces clavuligerus]MBY6304492.1 hypothetical protein [Streptomyces clavuligerus]